MNDPLQKNIVERYIGRGRYFRGEYQEKGIQAIHEGRKRFPFRTQQVHTFYLPYALQRYLLVGDQFKSHLTGSILDVGSRDNYMKNVLNIEAELVDKNNVNLKPFDWEQETLPYADGQFDTVVCLDTLEHINDLHRSFYDLLRVSKKRVIISLPNCWRKTFKRMLNGSSDQGAYGLPPERPMDRHKWFFNTEEIEDFFFYNAETAPHRYRVIEVKHHVPISRLAHRIIYPIIHAILPEKYGKNFLVNTSFFVLEKIA
jgi:hypothetical protein